MLEQKKNTGRRARRAAAPASIQCSRTAPVPKRGARRLWTSAYAAGDRAPRRRRFGLRMRLATVPRALRRRLRRGPWRAASTKSFWSAIWARTRRCGGSIPAIRSSSFPVATSETWRDKTSGERKEKTEWHNVVIFNENLGKVVEQYCKKGTKVYLEGQLQTRKWQDQSGADKYTTEVVLQRFRGELKLLDSRGGGEGRESFAATKSAAPARASPLLSRRPPPGALRRRRATRSTTTFRSDVLGALPNAFQSAQSRRRSAFARRSDMAGEHSSGARIKRYPKKTFSLCQRKAAWAGRRFGTDGRVSREPCKRRYSFPLSKSDFTCSLTTK